MSGAARRAQLSRLCIPTCNYGERVAGVERLLGQGFHLMEINSTGNTLDSYYDAYRLNVLHCGVRVDC